MLGPEDRATVDAFHRVYYDSEDTWKRTAWRGYRVLKCPFDLLVYAELVHFLQPDLIIETGTAHGGSALYLADLLELNGSGEVVTIDIEPSDRRPRHPRITYLHGSSTHPAVLADVQERAEGRSCMVILDSDHSAGHVYAELCAYAPLVEWDSFLIVEDGNVNGHPVDPDHGPGPTEAIERWLATDPGFVRDPGRERHLVTFNPGGYLRRVRMEQP